MSYLIALLLAVVVWTVLAVGGHTTADALYTPSDVGREYIEVSKALADAKLPVAVRNTLALRQAVLESQIRAGYSSRLTFEAHELLSTLAISDSNATVPPRIEISVSKVTPGKFSDYAWSVESATALGSEVMIVNASESEEDQVSPSKGIVKLVKLPPAVVSKGNEVMLPRLVATLKTDSRISESIVLDRKPSSLNQVPGPIPQSKALGTTK